MAAEYTVNGFGTRRPGMKQPILNYFRGTALACWALLQIQLSAGAAQLEATIAGTPANHQISWTSKLSHDHSILLNDDLMT
ncbi:MAG: hypothetical protein CMO80_08015 [Verrucomicrobiales bacterium]|nr:hypothetical protein [Verrucomicrobiales bacterium]